MDRQVIGYQKTEQGWEEILKPPPGMLYTQAFILCRECNGAILSFGGPMPNAYCLQCADTLKLKEFFKL